MIYQKTWVTHWASRIPKYRYTGWFFLGFIPLYIKRETA